mmetsp:Transcript_30786/g.74476  ORF Transcript_30786/g.74476 Transcript_30786/m.74476 type:complete len:121 (+) Transcript_30786:186-548(+)|eukprot:CAMPEP_0113470472 /NCGR_PEP_ID=MMETSP0014_2-20120614/16460_1 /TAXON_ID=2857 /ORGANISM="Nitzschia sp." /LENGTH=120 /DNA_ID=CAMNT_0000363037 /DNA_START=123 /DNA_END=485 /DNA_ORIENTATION=+ /assembly_acc=CAM_ASM_000159
MTTTTNESSNSSIEERLAMLESNKKFEATKEAIQEREVEFLAQLRLIKSGMVMTTAAQDGGGGGKGASATAGGANKGMMEQQQLKIENERLKALVAKQSFRIKHLVDEMEKKQIYKQQQR